MNETSQLFRHEEFGELNIIIIDDKPYFPATECAKILGYSNPRKAIMDHCKGVTKRDALTGGGRQGKNYIPEGDLYRLIIRSKLPAAEKFERWVFDTVVPSIRKYGAYISGDTLSRIIRNPELASTLLETLAREQAKSEQLEELVEELAPKAQYHDVILQCKSAIPVSIIAKDYGLSAIAFNKLLGGLGIQYKTGGTWLLYQKYADRGYTVTRTGYAGSGECHIYTCWTQRGRQFLYIKLAEYGIRPLPEFLPSANDSYCQARSGLSPPSYCPCRAHNRGGTRPHPRPTTTTAAPRQGSRRLSCCYFLSSFSCFAHHRS